MTQMVKVDFGAGKQPLVQWFKSVVLLLRPNSSGDDFTVSTDILVSWLKCLDDWYKGVGKVVEKRLHLLYHREVSVVGSGLLPAWRKLASIGAACRECGYGYSITVDAKEALEAAENLQALLAADVLTNFGLFVDEDATFDGATVNILIESILRRKIQLGLLGPVCYFQSAGLLASPVLNAADITLYPLGSTVSPSSSAWSIDPCFGRFRLFVDSDGRFYPCLGLVGVEAGVLGSVYHRIADTVLGGLPPMLDLEKLAYHGPDCPQNCSEKPVSGLPCICAHHRFDLLTETSPIRGGGLPVG